MIAVGVPFIHNEALGIFPISRPSACYLELTLGQPMLKLQCYTIIVFVIFSQSKIVIIYWQKVSRKFKK